MITAAGKTHIKRYLAKQVPNIGTALAFGVGSTSPTVNDRRLEFEVSRGRVHLITYDPSTDKLIFKGNVPDDIDGVVTEIALYSQQTDLTQKDIGPRLIDTFDDNGSWSNGGSSPTFSASNSRIGEESLVHAPAANGTVTSTLADVYFDFSRHTAADQFSLAFFNSNTNTASITLRFKTDNSNYYTYTISNPTAGYKVTSLAKGSGTVTGSPQWNNITSIEVATTAKAAGAAAVALDGLRIEDNSSISEEYVMVARQTLSSPFTKRLGSDMEVEFRMDIDV